jgi:transcriptional regulator of acetoin/glycerol metabolism
VRRAQSAQRAQSVERRHLFPELPPDPGPDATGLSFQELTRRYQRQVLVETLEATRWNISETARRLDLARSHIYNLVQAFDLSRDPPP